MKVYTNNRDPRISQHYSKINWALIYKIGVVAITVAAASLLSYQYGKRDGNERVQRMTDFIRNKTS